MYKALYRKYRPETFEDVVGQQIIIKILKNSIINNKITHAYLFTGLRGTGKTSVAKILAKIVNCEQLDGINPCNKCVNCTQINQKQNTDIIEIDAASNNGVDEIRELCDKVSLVPSYGKYKIYIVDEVHMLTTAAFNALLKTLEEPPKHIIFILATTEPHKIPMTILSRCQRFDFKRISNSEITKRLKYICDQEKIQIEENAINLIAKLSEGGMRDSINLLDQLTTYKDDLITIDDVHDVSGTLNIIEINNLLKQILNLNIKNVFELIEKYDSDGKNLNKIIELIIEHLKNVLIYYNSSDFFENTEDKTMYDEICKIISEEKIHIIVEILLNLINQTKNTSNVKLLFELAIIKINTVINEKIENKEKKSEIIYEPQKKIESNFEIKKIEISDKLKEQIEQLKKIRVNNTLAKFNKKNLNEFKKNIDEIKILLMDPEFSSIVSLILDGEIKAIGNDYLIYVYKIDNLSEYFNTNLIIVENIFKKVYNINYKPIALSEKEWDPIKTKFNEMIKENKNLYIFKDDDIDVQAIFNTSKKINVENEDKHTNEIENMFKEIIQYK